VEHEKRKKREGTGFKTAKTAVQGKQPQHITPQQKQLVGATRV
jgi:hypothetical protein